MGRDGFDAAKITDFGRMTATTGGFLVAAGIFAYLLFFRCKTLRIFIYFCAMISLLHDLARLFFPRTCRLCHRELHDGEEGLCLVCQAGLPRLAHYKADNAAEIHLAGKFRFEHGASYCFYKKGSPFARLLVRAKYGGTPKINEELAVLFARELEREGWPWDIDTVMAVPAHWRRQFWRGYNQSHAIALALGRRWHLRVEKGVLYKSRHTPSQVHQGYEGRRRNLQGSIAVHHADRIAGRHILIVDDILTSGATLEACAVALLAQPDVRVSFLTLGLSR